MKTFSLADRLRYKFDDVMSRGPIALILWLFLASLVLILVISLLAFVIRVAPEGGEPLSFAELMWMSLMRTLDAGTMGGDTGWGVRIFMFIITLGGVFVVSMLIGVLTTTIEGKIVDLRKGHSFVVENGHTVILGWSSQIFSIISELVIANENQKSGCIAVLAEKDKVEMEDEIRSRVGNTKNTHVVCRTGNPIDVNELHIVNPFGARSIIILSPEGDNADSQVIKIILALTNSPQKGASELNIVAEILDSRNLAVAQMVGGKEAHLILTDGLISRIIAQTCRQSGLSIIYTELLDFGGDEIYFAVEPSLVGKTFGEALFVYEDTALIGIQSENGSVRLNPPMETRVTRGDRLVVISEDDDTIHLSGMSEYGINSEAIRAVQVIQPVLEHTLILGWNRCGVALIHELDNYVARDSKVLVIANTDEIGEELDRLSKNLKNQKILLQKGDTTSRELLESLELVDIQHVIILSYSEEFESQEADAQTLITLLHLRDLAMKSGYSFSMVSQMLDLRNRELAEIAKADDFIVSDKLISLMLSQISENHNLSDVFEDLFNPEGSELYLKKAEDYITLGIPVNFYSVLEAARRRGEVAVGYRCHAERNNSEKAYGVVVNPVKSKLVSFAENDRIIVLAEN